MHLARIRKHLIRQRRFRQLLAASLLIAIAFGILIVPIERQSPNSSITSLDDGIWWSVQTLTTVGYGDTVPQTLLGRVLGIAMLLTGVIMFSALIALISTSMSRGQEEFYWRRLFERLDRMEEKIAKIEKEHHFSVKHTHNSQTSPDGHSSKRAISQSKDYLERDTLG